MTNKSNNNVLNIKKQEKTIIFVFIAAILFYTVFVGIADYKKIVNLSLKFHWEYLPLILILTVLNYIVRAMRFRYLLSQIKINFSFRESLSIFLSGLSMTITPGKAGEVIKAYLVKKRAGNAFSQTIPLLVTERLTDGIAMIILGLAGVYYFKNSALFFLFSTLFICAFILSVKAKNKIIGFIKWFERKFTHIKVLDFFVTFFQSSQTLLSGRNLAAGVLFGIVAWFFEGLALFLIVKQFSDVSLIWGMAISLFIFSFSSIAGFFVFIPGGIGVAEGSITYFLTTFFSMPLSNAVFVTIIFRFATLWFGVGIGLVALLQTLKDTNNK